MTHVEALNFIFETNDCCYCKHLSNCISNCKNQCETAYDKIYNLCKKADEKEIK